MKQRSIQAQERDYTRQQRLRYLKKYILESKMGWFLVSQEELLAMMSMERSTGYNKAVSKFIVYRKHRRSR